MPARVRPRVQGYDAAPHAAPRLGEVRGLRGGVQCDGGHSLHRDVPRVPQAPRRHEADGGRRRDVGGRLSPGVRWGACTEGLRLTGYRDLREHRGRGVRLKDGTWRLRRLEAPARELRHDKRRHALRAVPLREGRVPLPHGRSRRGRPGRPLHPQGKVRKGGED